MDGVLPANDRKVIVTRDEFRELYELVLAIQKAVNQNAHLIDLHQHILAKFVPEPLLQKACDDFHAKSSQAQSADA